MAQDLLLVTEATDKMTVPTPSLPKAWLGNSQLQETWVARGAYSLQQSRQ